MRIALAQHDATLSVAIESNGGWLFKHTGDGVIAAFAAARPAIDAAIAAQRQLDLPVRMGICTGETELRGDDVFRTGLEPGRAYHGGGTWRASARYRFHGVPRSTASTWLTSVNTVCAICRNRNGYIRSALTG